MASGLGRRQSPGPVLAANDSAPTGDWRQAAKNNPEDLVLESWSQGFIVGALLVMACITIANMRKGVLLHKLILLELIHAMSHGTFCFMTFNGYGWYLSATAAMLYLSWIIHNIVAWMKVRPFFTQPGGFFKASTGKRVMRVYLSTLALTVPIILFQITDNFRFFNNYGGWYTKVRPYEPLFRDPWWIFTCLTLFHVIRKCYGTGVIGLIKRSPRFGIMLSAIAFSIIFTVVDIIASIHSFIGTTDGINPWWKLSLVFKCLTDTIMLDDFKTELKRLGIRRIEKAETRRNSVALVTEYPSGLDGSDPAEYSQPRCDTLLRYSDNTLASCNTSRDSTTCHSEFKGADGKSEDPLSEYAAHCRSICGQNKQGTHEPSVRTEEVEFATALTMDPSHKSNDDSTNRHRDIEVRHNIRNSTKKIANLPGLREFRFEAIKPGKRSAQSKHEESSDDENDGIAENKSSSRSYTLAEEVQRNTILDLEAQQLAAKDTVHRGRGKKKPKDYASKEENNGEDDEEEEYKRRVKRFRQSIGAAD